MRRRLLASAGLLGLLGVVLAVDQPAEPRSPGARADAVQAGLETFWRAFLRADAVGLRAAVDLPLTLVDEGDGDQPGERYLVGEEDWPAFRRDLPPLPLASDRVGFELEDLRLEWLDGHTCLAVCQLAATVEGRAVGGKYAALLVDRDGWRVAVATVPR